MTEYVCLDTNSWFTESLLHSAVGSAVLYLIAHTNRRLLLPDLVEGELKALVLRTAGDDLSKASETIRRNSELLGVRISFLPPDNAQAIDAINARMNSFSSFLERATATDSARVRAFDRIIEARVPNSAKNQQAKDSLLWETLMDLPKDTSVILVSADNAFFEGSSLANELAEQCRSLGISIRAVRSCTELLTLVGEIVPPVEKADVWKALSPLMTDAALAAVGKVVTREIITIIEEPRFGFSLFMTSNPSLVAVSIDAATTAQWGDSGPGEFRFNAQAIFDASKGVVDSLEVSGVSSPMGSGLVNILSYKGFGSLAGQELRVPHARIEAGLARRNSSVARKRPMSE